MELPLFPLKKVLFPREELSLFIFEPRYRQMIGACIQEDAPFGVVLIRQGEEVGEPAVPRDVGTTARITQADQLASGRLKITAKGGERYRIRYLKQERPFLVAEVDVLADRLGNPDGIEPSVRAIRDGYRTYVELLQVVEGKPGAVAVLDLPHDPVALSYDLPPRLKLLLKEQQALLEAETVAERLALEVQILRREGHALRWLAEKRGRGEEAPIAPFYIN